jgi:outer membrane protein assembly factor BamA
MRRASLTTGLFLLLFLLVTPGARAQATKAPQQPVSEHLPYSFSNFPWWTDAQIRAELRHRIPSLGDEVGRGSAQEARVRDELTAMVASKGLHATVASDEPSPTFGAVSAFVKTLPFYIPGSAQRPHIVFSIAAPQILVGGIDLDSSPEGDIVARIARQMEGKPFDAGAIPLQAHQLAEPLQRHGYLSAEVVVTPGHPMRVGDTVYVPMKAEVSAGPLYHVGLISADGGPLLHERDLSGYYDLQPGEVAAPYAFDRLESSIMTVYFQAGYASVHFVDQPVLDPDHAVANYRLVTVTGPQYRIRTVTVRNLSPAQEAEVRNLLALSPGDVYDQIAIDELHAKVQESANLKGLDYSFAPATDRNLNVIDLTLDFFKDSAQSSL